LAFIDSCLEQLQPTHRETIELVFFKKLKYREYQRLYGLSKSGAEKKIKRAILAFESLFLLKT
jgi:DNA-directed RNA polymerase specialized sigma24 family protein